MNDPHGKRTQRGNFSLTYTEGDVIGETYKVAKAMSTTVASVFRTDLMRYRLALSTRYEALSRQEKIFVDDAARVLSGSYLTRSEGEPDRYSILTALRKGASENVIAFVRSADMLLLCVVLTKAREIFMDECEKAEKAAKASKSAGRTEAIDDAN